jgi:hypothetical protein
MRPNHEEAGGAAGDPARFKCEFGVDLFLIDVCVCRFVLEFFFFYIDVWMCGYLSQSPRLH